MAAIVSNNSRLGLLSTDPNRYLQFAAYLIRCGIVRARLNFKSYLHGLRRLRPILWRAIFCWALGIILLVNDEVSSFDFRFQLRGDQPVDPGIVIIKMNPNEILSNYRLHGRLSSWKNVADLTDSFYWDPQVWKKLLVNILAQKPKAVGVTLFLMDHLSHESLTDQDLQLFFDRRVFWATQDASHESRGRALFSLPEGENTGGYDLLRDEDGVIRRFGPSNTSLPHLTERVAGISLQAGGSALINYRGGPHIWPRYTLSEVIEDKLPHDALKGKYVLIGADFNPNSQYLTPLGPDDRVSVMAQITDNLLANRWIKRAPTSLFTVLLLGLLIVCVILLLEYPQTVAAVFLLWILTLITALSIWIFDDFWVWTPVYSAAVQTMATWIVFLGYQANRYERKNQMLKQEQRNLQELEELKNNFISLISHDLKTPIAKSQAVIDRLMTGSVGGEAATGASITAELFSDLQLLHGFNDELHRYIQSILRLLRVESRDFELHITPGDINETVEDVVRQLQPLIQSKEHHLTLDLETLFTLEGDFTLLREVILNLVENAVKYTPAKGSIGIKSFEASNAVVIEVTDSGPGIPKSELTAVWRKFVRGKDQDLKSKGTGLGLYLVKYFIELHGGSVHLESEVGRGTKAIVRLPLERPLVPSSTSSPSTQPRSSTAADERSVGGAGQVGGYGVDGEAATGDKITIIGENREF
ncbi:MAG: histidine kinase [Bdellovibrio sp.]|nr:MAG: histidine kinase [Bdellovibrio sp.]